jgi:hypothetical protein
MGLKYPIFVLAIFLIAMTGANATNDYSILVGAHEVRFNTSSSFFEQYYNDTTYSPVVSGNFGLDYTKSETTLWSDKPFLTVTVRDFKTPIPVNAYFLEENTLSEFMNYMPLGNRRSTHDFANRSVNGVVADHGNEFFGALMAWPSDQTEIIITGSLPNIEIWRDISFSIELVR